MASLEAEDDLRNDIARSNFAGMLHDQERNRKYDGALKHVLHELNSSGTSAHVLDIGTGTGILAMMAARAGAPEVTACEMFEPMARIAEKIVTTNNLNRSVAVINKNSTDIVVPDDMPTRANVLVTEIFDTELLGEGVLPTLRDAHKRLLAPNCHVIPEAADVIVQLIESDELWGMQKLIPDRFELKLPESMKKCAGTAAPHEIQINRLYPNHLKLLSESTSMTSFNFCKAYEHNVCEKYSVVERNLKVTKSGYVHGVLFWWNLIMNKSQNIVLSMEPIWMRNQNEYVWRDHWMQAVYYLKEPLFVEQDESLFVKMCFDDYSIWFDVTKMKKNVFIERPLCTCGFHVVWPRERFAMWNSPSVQASFKKLKAGMNSVVVGDTSLLPFFCNTGLKLTYVECSAFKGALVEKMCDINYMKDQLEIVSLETIVSKPDVIVFEPYFSSCLLPWHHMMQASSIVKLLETKTDSSYIAPRRVELKACVVSLTDLWKVRAPVCKVNDFDLSDFDVLIDDALAPFEIHGNFFEGVEPYSMWEYGHEILSEPVVLAEFDLRSSFANCNSYSGEFVLKNCGTAHGIVLWVDYMLNGEILWTTGLNESQCWVNFCRQGLYFIKSPVSLQVGHKIRYRICVLPEVPDILFAFE